MITEVVRSMHGSAYDRWVPNNLDVREGWAYPPTAPGLGTSLDPDGIREDEGVATRGVCPGRRAPVWLSSGSRVVTHERRP